MDDKLSIQVRKGMVLSVPLLEGSLSLALVVGVGGTVRLGLFAHRRATVDELFAGLSDALTRKLFAVIEADGREIENGNWPVIAQDDSHYPAADMQPAPRRYEAKAIPALFEAVYGLRPWDEPAVTGSYEEMLIPGMPVPKMARMRADFDQRAAELQAAAATFSPRPPLPEGGGVIHIEIPYEGDDLPNIHLVRRREAIERGLESAGAGEVIDAGGGEGIMDIWLETPNVEHAMPFVLAAVKEAGFAETARIEVDPGDEEGSDQVPEEATGDDKAM